RAGRACRKSDAAKVKCDLLGFGLLSFKRKEGCVRKSGDRLAIHDRIRGDRLKLRFQPVTHRRGPTVAVQPRFGYISRSTRACAQRQRFSSCSMPSLLTAAANKSARHHEIGYSDNCTHAFRATNLV